MRSPADDGYYYASAPADDPHDLESAPRPAVRPPSTTTSTSSDDALSAALGCLICLAFLFLLVFILSYPVSSAYQYDPVTERHNLYFRANPNVYPYAP